MISKNKQTMWPIAVLTADTHLSDRTWVDRKSLAGDAYYAFSQIVDYAIANTLPIIAAGDLIDRRKNESHVVDFIRSQMDKLADAEVPFLYIQGQHELQYPVPWLSAIHAHPVWLDYRTLKKTLCVDGLRVCGFDWMPTEHVEPAMATVPENTDILVMHQVCQDFMGGIAESEFSFDKTPHAGFLLVGDYHVSKIMDAHGAQGQPVKVLSCGSTSMQAVNESSDKCFFVLYSDGTEFQTECIPLSSRICWRPDPLMTQEDLDNFISDWPDRIEQLVAQAVGMPPDLRTPLVEVQYSGELADAYLRLVKTAGDDAHLFLAVIPTEAKEELEIGKRARRDAVQGGLLGCLPLLVDSKADVNLFRAASRLLSAGDNAREELATMRTEAGL